MTPLLYIVLAAAGVFAVWFALNIYWRGLGAYRIHRAGPRPLRATAHRIWRDPSPEERLDAANGPAGGDGAPVPPFHFVEEHTTGSQPCVSVRDGRQRLWRVKWGNEVRSEAFAVRFAWACGYFAEVNYFVPAGRIHNIATLQRTHDCIDLRTGDFTEARFELDDTSVKKLFEEHSWQWDNNPFVGSAELSGLKIVVMLLSNWDTKDRRDVARGSNTAIFEHRLSSWRREARYLITDWGGSMGKWGSTIVTRGRWDVAGFEEQTPQFVTGTRDGMVLFGYAGQRTADVAHDIPVHHVQWFRPWLERVDETYLHDALVASGADENEATRFARAMRERIGQLTAIT